MCDYQMSHGRGILLSLILNFACEHAPYGGNVRRTCHQKKDRKNRINRYKKEGLKCTPHEVVYSRTKRRANICPGFLRVKTCTNNKLTKISTNITQILKQQDKNTNNCRCCRIRKLEKAWDITLYLLEKSCNLHVNGTFS